MQETRSQPGPYDPCYCRSGRKYKFCHYPIDSAPAADRRELSQKMYIALWERSANYFGDQGCYKWMGSILAKYLPNLVLDIGCGNGDGIVAIKQACPSSRIISCDDNAYCLQTTQDRIKAMGLNVELIRRLRQRSAGDGYHQMEAVAGILKTPTELIDISLIEADIIWDKEFRDFLKTLAKFDAITVWLIGTYHLKPECRNLGSKVEAGIYRLKVQNSVYTLADQVLRVGGVLQIVDRGELPREKHLIDETYESHREQAEGTSLEVVQVDFIQYEELSNGTGVSTIRTLGLSGRMPEHNQLAMNSVISIKR